MAWSSFSGSAAVTLGCDVVIGPLLVIPAETGRAS
jgi:hypothetical protein